MEWFNAHVTVDRLYRDPEDNDLIDQLDGWHPSISAWPDGRLSARISLTAASMMDAAVQALVVVREATGTDAVALELMTEREFCEREGFARE